jgi:hypothetical protein
MAYFLASGRLEDIDFAQLAVMPLRWKRKPGLQLAC